jgi:ribose transport system substrate-binding protein
MRRPLLALGLLALLSVLSCGGDGGGGSRRLAVIPKGTAHEFWKAVQAGATSACRASGAELLWVGPQPEGDRNAQIAVVENMITRGVDGIVLMPVDKLALRGVCEEARAAGIAVVIADSGLDWEGQVSYVATDNRRGGELAGATLAELLGGKGRVILLRYVEGSESTHLREEGFLSALAAYPGIEILSSNQYAGNTKEGAQETSENLLTAHSEIDGIFCPNESAAHGMLRALEAAGRAGQVRFIGFDASASLLEGLRQGHMDALVLQDPVRMGALAVETLVQHLDGKAVQARVDTGVYVATRANMDEPKVQALLQPDLSVLAGR